MSKELKKLYKNALVSINYFFLKIVFNEKDILKCNISNQIYESVRCELSTLLETIKKEGLNEEVCILFKEELNSSNYLEGKSKAEIKNYFRKAISDMFGHEYPELFEFYTELI